MAFEDFQNNEPVIILNDHENLEKLYTDVTIVDGQDASPDTFNKNIRDSVSRDVNLEAAVTYLARSASLYTTNNAKFLSHCEGEGVDIISYKSPFTGESGTEAKELFTTDDTFLGAAYPQGEVTNMVVWKEGEQKVFNRYPRKTSQGTGWTMVNTMSEPENVVIVEDTDNSYLSISNETITGAKAAGTISFTSDKLDIVATKGGIPSAMSVGFTLKTGNLITANAAVQLTVNMYKNKTATSPVTGGTFTRTISNIAEFNNIVALENLVLPTEIKTSSQPAFNIVITVYLSNNATPITMYLSKIMAHDGEALYTWTENHRNESYLQYGTNKSLTINYNGIVDLENNDAVTVWFWSKFSEYAIKQTTNPIGPIFLSWKTEADELTLGFVHKHNLDNLEMCLAINKNGTVTYSSEKITLPRSYFGKYFLSAMRFRKSIDEETGSPTIILEVAFAIDGKILTISKEFANGYFPQDTNKIPAAIIIVGKDVCVDSTMLAHNDIFSSKISEIRYDTEWVNDLELYLASLGRKPFSFKQSTDAQVTTKQKSTTEVIDAAGINMITNATGKYALIGWTQYNTGTNFTVSHTDQNMGNCFNYTGTAINNVLIYSDPIKISPNLLYSLRAFMKTRQNDTGKVAIGVRFQTGSTFYPNASTSSDIQATCSNTGKAAYYSAQKVSPSSAEYAFVYMYVEAGSNVSAQWSKIKLEQGEPTFFTEDCGANYAIYY